MNYQRSETLFAEAQKHLVGGVNSPVRAFGSVGGHPVLIDRGEGAYIYDVDGNGYIDYVGSFGPLILGHTKKEVNDAVKRAIDKGSSFGATTEAEIVLAKLIKEAFPGMNKVRFVSSGTEAVMSAIRLARAFTGKTKIVKFAGCYHGHSDFLLAQAGSGVATLSLPGSAGVPEATVKDTIIATYNDIEEVKAVFSEYKNNIAGVVIEPVAGNMGVVLPKNDFLQQLRKITRENCSVLIFDEVMCGFRERFGGAQHYFEVEPDITCLGKIIGGGFPVGAYGAREEIMNKVAPLGPMYQAGTLSGNPVAMAAGIAMLELLKDTSVYDHINQYTVGLAQGIMDLTKARGVEIQVPVFGSMITPFFTGNPVKNYADAQSCNTKQFSSFFRKLLESGIYPPPSQFEAWFISAAHGEDQLRGTLKAVEAAL